MGDFYACVTSTGSKTYFNDNKYSAFTNVLCKPLSNMNEYCVGLASFAISVETPKIILICSDIVKPIFYNDLMLPILGVYHSKQLLNKSVIAFSPVVCDEVQHIRCTLYDHTGQELVIGGVAPVVTCLLLHFQKRK